MSRVIDISIIIVTWNSEEDIIQCLDSIERASQNIDVEIFVVDNNSRDNTVNIVQKSYPDVKLISNHENFGFAKANNQAIKMCSGKYILLLNPDTVLNTTSLNDSLTYMEQNADIGVLGCMIKNSDGSIQPSVRRFPTVFSQILVLCKLHNFFPRIASLKKYFASDFDYSSNQNVDQVMGAYMFVNRNCVEKIGLLDEGFWIWFEDVDYCKRAKDAGFKVTYNPNISIMHKQSRSFEKLLAKQEQRIFNKSMFYYAKKHFNRFSYILLKCFQPISIMLAMIVGMFENKINKVHIK